MIRTAPHAAPEKGVASPKALGGRPRSLLLERLRARIAGIAAAPNLIAPGLITPCRIVPEGRKMSSAAASWALGLAEIDRHLPETGLAEDGVHEIAPAAYGDMPAALGFAAALAVRRLASRPADERPLLWCRLGAGRREWGRLYGHGLEGLGLARQRLITVTLNKPDAIFWTIEEALKSAALTGVIADVGPGLDLTAVRRLMLAAGAGSTPALLLFPARPHGTTAARTRWIIAAQASVPPPFDAKAPGAPAWQLRLVRCRGGRSGPGSEQWPDHWFVEWSHATHRFTLASAVCHRTADPGDAPGKAPGEPAAGAGRGGGARLAARRL